VVLVTGVSRFVPSALAGQLARHPRVEKVIGVDAVSPDAAARARLGRAEFTRVDLRNPVVYRVIEAAGVDTVVHAAGLTPPPGVRVPAGATFEATVLGTMQLLAACQRATSLRSLIVRSTAAVYGGSTRDPAVFDETDAEVLGAAGSARDATDIESYVRGFMRRRPDVRVAVPRLAEVVGPSVRTPFTGYFALSPLVPVPLGRDPRLQVLHELDAVAVLHRLVMGDFSGAVNVAGDGVLSLHQAVHRTGRIPVPVPLTGLRSLAAVARLVGVRNLSPAQLRDLTRPRVMDTGRLRRELGFTPRMSTIEAFDDFARSLPPVLPAGTVRSAEVRLAGLAGATPAPMSRPATAGDGAARATRPARHLVGIDGHGPGARRRRPTRGHSR
jgi:UDP-glucose 4-epimerase